MRSNYTSVLGKGLVMALIAGGSGSAYAAGLQPMAYSVGTQSTYSFDLTGTNNLSLSSAGSTNPGQANHNKSIRVTGTFKSTPISTNALTGTTYLHINMPSAPSVMTGDESGAWTPVAADSTTMPADFVVEQGPDGAIQAVDFAPLPTNLSADQVQSTLNFQAIMKGLAATLDFRPVAQGAPAFAGNGIDTLGSYQATYTRLSATQIQIQKNGYTSLANGAGVFTLDGETATPFANGALQVSGSSTVTLDANGGFVSRHIDNETVQVVQTGPVDAPPATPVTGTNLPPPTEMNDGGTFSAGATFVVTGDVTLQGTAPDPTGTNFQIAPYADHQSPMVQMSPVMAATVNQSSEANALMAEGIERAQQPSSRLMAVGLLSRAIYLGADVEEIRARMMDPRTDAATSETLCRAMGAARTPGVRKMMGDLLRDPRSKVETRNALLQGLEGSHAIEEELVDTVESLTKGQAASPLQARRTLASLVPALAAKDEARAAWIVEDLLAQYDHTSNLMEKSRLLHDLAATRSPRALQVLTQYDGSAEDAFQQATRLGAAFTASNSSAQVVSQNQFCDLLKKNPDLTDYISSDSYCNGSIVSKSAGTNFLGGTLWAGAGLGVNGTTRGAYVLGAGLEGSLLGIKLPLLSLTYYMRWDQANSANYMNKVSYSTLWDPQSDYTFTADQAGTRDTPPESKKIASTWYTFRIEFPVFCFEGVWSGGLGSDHSIDSAHSDLKNFKASTSTQDSGAWAQATPWADIAAWTELTVGWACLDVGLELRGDFLKVGIPVRADYDPHSVTDANGNTTLNYGLTSWFQVTPWSIALIGHFDYCFGSATKTLWSASANPEKWQVGTWQKVPSDLTVQGLSWKPSVDPDTSKPLVFSVTIGNTKRTRTSPATPLITSVYVDGTKVNSFTVADANGNPRPLSSGETYTGQVVWPAPTAGTHTIKAVVNDASSSARVYESDYTNNSSTPATLVVKPALPDIVVGSVQVTKPASSTATVQITLDNMGPAADPQVVVSGGLIPVYGPAPITYSITSPTGAVLATGKTTLHTATSVSFPSSGLTSINVTANSDNAIKERTASDNTMANIDITRADTTAPVTSVSYTGLVDRVQELHQYHATISEDSRVDRVDWFVDNILQYSDRSAFPAGSIGDDFLLDTRGLSESVHSIVAKAYDKAGHVGASPSLSFTVKHPDLVQPTASAVSVVDLNGVYTLKATASDAKDGVDHVDFYIDQIKVGTLNAAPYTLVIPNNDDISFGSHSFYALAYDRAASLDEGGWANVAVSNGISFDKSSTFLEVEPNDTLAQANPLYSYSKYISGSFPAHLVGTITDCFRIPVGLSQTITLGGCDSLNVTILDASGNQVATNGGGSSFVSWTNTSTTSAYVYAKVESLPIATQAINYLIQVKLQGPGTSQSPTY